MSVAIHFPDHILYEDAHIIVLNKPAGIMVEPDRNGHANLQHQLKKYLHPSAPLQEIYAQHIHRLDRPVSGVILFAKQKAVLKNLSEQFAERKVKKYYRALTEHAPAQRDGTLNHWHRKEKKKAVIYDEQLIYAEQVSLSYSITDVDGKFLWDVELHTGKYHQIRAQLSHMGAPIIGDNRYGSVIAYEPNAIALQAYKLVFSHPITNEELTIEIAPVHVLKKAGLH